MVHIQWRYAGLARFWINSSSITNRSASDSSDRGIVCRGPAITSHKHKQWVISKRLTGKTHTYRVFRSLIRGHANIAAETRNSPRYNRRYFSDHGDLCQIFMIERSNIKLNVVDWCYIRHLGRACVVFRSWFSPGTLIMNAILLSRSRTHDSRCMARSCCW